MKALGQHIILEAVFIFTIGLFITIALFSTFGSFRDISRVFSEEDQAKLLASFFIMKISEIQNIKYGYIEFEIPQKIASSGYLVSFEGNKITVIAQNKAYVSKIYGLENLMTFSGKLTSNFKKARIEINNNRVRLSGV